MPNCSGCTLCCYVLPVPSLNKKAGERCKYCDSEVGCKIYAVRPEECRNFKCAYFQVNCSEDLRPDKCNIVFEKVSDDIFFGTMHPGHNDAYKIGAGGKQVINFLQQGFSVVLNSPSLGKPIVIPKKGKKPDEVWLEFHNRIRERNDCALIHD